MAENKITRHWPTALLGTLVAAVLLVAVFSYQVDETQLAVVTTFGQIEDQEPAPGLHFRWPYPIQQVHTFDKRDQIFKGQDGMIEETSLASFDNLIVGIFVIYRIDDARKFFENYKAIPEAENALNTWMRAAKKNVFSRYNTNAIFNTNPDQIKLDAICAGIRDEIARLAEPKGMDIRMVGVNTLNIPSGVTNKVYERMAAERETEARRFEAEGESQARQIRANADAEREKLLSEAHAKAREIQAEGDAAAAEYYSVFAKNPELAAFLRNLEALKGIINTKATLILDDRIWPFRLLQPEALNQAMPKAQ